MTDFEWAWVHLTECAFHALCDIENQKRLNVLWTSCLHFFNRGHNDKRQCINHWNTKLTLTEHNMFPPPQKECKLPCF